MAFYILFLIFTLTNVAMLNIIFQTDSWYMIILFVFISFVFEFVLDAIIALAIRRLIPEKWIKPNKFPLKVFKWEKRVLEFFGIKKWKDHIPELGGATNFHKNHLGDTNSPEYLDRFILESGYGELIHTASMIGSFLILFLGFIKPQFTLPIFLPCAFINLFLNMLPTLIQRYVRPRLFILRERLRRLEERKVKKENSNEENNMA